MRFIHFGCWNKGFCDIELGENGLSKTMKKLNEFVEINKDIEFIMIAGDNYYPDKLKKLEKKEKNMITENFLSGINCLPKHVLKYVLLGNHEFDKVKLDGNDDDDVDICYLFKSEKNIFNKLNNTIFFNDVIHRIFGNNTLIIMIDTTLYEIYDDSIAENKEINLYDTCYKYLFLENDELNEKKIGLKFEDLIIKQKNKIQQILNNYNNYTNVVFIGHHPIITKKIKEKDGKIKEKTEINNGLINLYKSLDTLLFGKKIYYLCADTHNFQSGEIRINELIIEQYITGTGGAEQDKCIIPSIEFQKIDENVFYKINICKNKYGFLIIDEKDNNLNFKIEDSKDASELEGGCYDKYMKYKMKYLQLKK